MLLWYNKTSNKKKGGKHILKENMKKRLAVFLCILFVLPAIMAVLPQTAQEVQAAKGYIDWHGTTRGRKGILTVEQGTSFYIGDFARYYNNGVYLGTASMFKASYSSSNGNVAAINSKGYVETRNIGKSNITIKYKGNTLNCILTVVEAGSFGTNEEFTKLAEAADVIAKNMPKAITAKNGFRILKIFNQYQDLSDNLSSVSDDGFIVEYYESTEKLVVPNASRYNKLYAQLERYAAKNSPISTKSSKKINITSIHATERQVTINLAKAISKDQILALKMNPSWYAKEKNLSSGNNKAYFFTLIVDQSNERHTYTGLVCMTKGSKKVTVTPCKANGKRTKMKKNKTYQIDDSLKWLKGKTFTVR